MVKLTSSSIVGSATESTWSQAQTIVLPDSSQLMVVVQLRCETESTLIDLATIGAEILSEFEQATMLGNATEQIKAMVDHIVVSIAEGVMIHLLVGHVVGDSLRLYGMGEVVAYLMRGDQLANLQSEWGTGASVAGVVKPQDVLFLATRTLALAIGVAKIKETLSSEAPAELLAPLVHAQPETSGLSAVVAEIAPDEQVVIVPFWQRFLKREPKIQLDRHEPRKMNLWIGVGILTLLIIMIGVGMVKRSQAMAERDYGNLDKSVTQKIEETLSIGDLNPERARALLTAAKGEVDAYLETKPKDGYATKAQQLAQRIEETEEQAFKKNTVQLATIVELPILAEDLSATKMKSDGKGNLLFLDTKNPRIVQMNLTDRSRVIIPTDSVGTLTDIGVAETTVYGLTNEGVASATIKKPEFKKVIEPDEFWKEPTEIGIFAGNVYVLDRGQGEVWKYPTLGDTFGSRRRWFAAGISLDLSNVVDMKVVGDIWFLTSTGKLERYSRGAPAAFSMDGFPAKGEDKRLSDPIAVYPTESLIYVLERGAARVVVFGDDGAYKAQYVNPEFGKASDLVVQDGKGYVLIENAVKSFQL